MEPYTVLYTDSSLMPADPPLAFACQADDTDHAEEQCADAYKDDANFDIVWVVQTADVDAAYADYWFTENEDTAMVIDSTKRYLVLLAARGNPDVQQDPDRPPFGCPEDQLVFVGSIEKAQTAVREYIARWNIGGGQWVGGDVQDGKTLAHVGMVHYNGRYAEGEQPSRGAHVVFKRLPIYDTPMFAPGVPADAMERTMEVPYEQFARIVADLALHPDEVGELDEKTTHDRFVEAMAGVVAQYCGGMVLAAGYGKITVAPTDSLPGSGMGIWEHGAEPVADDGPSPSRPKGPGA